VTGNVIVGPRDDLPVALAVVAVDRPAVTGNVVVGRAALPPRTLPAPLDSWHPFNEISF
jgi:hypothetical protein